MFISSAFLALLFSHTAAQVCADVGCVSAQTCSSSTGGCQNEGICNDVDSDSNGTVDAFACDCSLIEFEGDFCQTATITPTWGEWGTCDKLCGYGLQTRSCEPVGAVCPDDSEGGSTKACATFECQNCSFSYGRWSDCTKTCGTGTRDRSNDIRTPGTPGAIIECPPLFETEECNTQMCRAYITGIGYRYWKITGPTVFTYTVGSLRGNRGLDLFLFQDGEDIAAYRRDVARNKYARNYGYSTIKAEYDTENSAGSVSLGPGTYYFVVDNSYVGLAKPQENDPDESPDAHFTFALGGGEWGMGENTASRAQLSAMAFFLIVSNIYLFI